MANGSWFFTGTQCFLTRGFSENWDLGAIIEVQGFLLSAFLKVCLSQWWRLGVILAWTAGVFNAFDAVDSRGAIPRIYSYKWAGSTVFFRSI